MSKLFSEVYGCYYGIVSHIIRSTKGGIRRNEIEAIINEKGFSETAFHLLPRLLDGQWNFLEKKSELYYSKFDSSPKRALTQLELSWLKSLLKDPRFGLFFSEEKMAEYSATLKDIEPLFDVGDFISTDVHLDADPYADPDYIANFRKILAAIKNNDPILIFYDSEKSGRSKRTYYPFKLSYSGLNDKFRLLCAAFRTKTQKLNKVTLNLGKIISVEPSPLPYRVTPNDLCKLFSEPSNNPPIVVEISNERNSLERFLLQFASFDRKTEYDSERDIYICQIYYDMADETELLIRILGFGPTVRVLSPQSFVDQIKERLAKQIQLFLCGKTTC